MRDQTKQIIYQDLVTAEKICIRTNLVFSFPIFSVISDRVISQGMKTIQNTQIVDIKIWNSYWVMSHKVAAKFTRRGGVQDDLYDLLVHAPARFNKTFKVQKNLYK